MPNLTIEAINYLTNKTSEFLVKKGTLFGFKMFVKSDAFDHMVATGICTVCAGVSAYGLVMSAPLAYEHARAFVKCVKPTVTEAMEAAEEAA